MRKRDHLLIHRPAADAPVAVRHRDRVLSFSASSCVTGEQRHFGELGAVSWCQHRRDAVVPVPRYLQKSVRAGGGGRVWCVLPEAAGEAMRAAAAYVLLLAHLIQVRYESLRLDFKKILATIPGGENPPCTGSIKPPRAVSILSLLVCESFARRRL